MPVIGEKAFKNVVTYRTRYKVIRNFEKLAPGY